MYGVTLTVARSVGEFGPYCGLGNILGRTQTATLYVHDTIESFIPTALCRQRRAGRFLFCSLDRNGGRAPAHRGAGRANIGGLSAVHPAGSVFQCAREPAAKALKPRHFLSARETRPMSILVKDLVKRLGRSMRRRVTFEVPAGQLVALLGPSGSGKSTISESSRAGIGDSGEVQ